MLRNGTNVKPIPDTQALDTPVTTTKGWETLDQDILVMWQQAHGAPQGAVTVMAVRNGLVVLIENAFSQAELALASRSTDNLLQQYVDSLARQTLPALITRAEEVTGWSLGAASVTSNIEQNWLMVFIRFGEPGRSRNRS
jgi:hypothetical protein